MASPPPKPDACPEVFAIACPCGEVRRGERRARHQILTCPKCGRKQFVLPRSPWPNSADELARLSGARQRGAPAQSNAKAARASSPWWQPVVAGLVTLFAAGIAVGGLLAYLGARPKAAPTGTLQDHFTAALRSLGRRDLPAAQAALQAARADAARAPERYACDETARLQALEQQVGLVCSLAATSLEEMLLEARDAPAAKWAARFDDCYSGRGLAFDARIARSAEGKAEYRVDYVLEAEGTPGRVSAADFRQAQILFDAPEPRRWLFGGRLASFMLEADPERQPGQWVVRFQPGSLVLITEPEVIAYLGLEEDAGLMDRARSQRIEPALWSNLALPDGPKPGDGVEVVQRLYGQPDRVSRQILAGRLIEQWAYARQPALHFNLDRPFGRPAVVARLGPRLPR